MRDIYRPTPVPIKTPDQPIRRPKKKIWRIIILLIIAIIVVCIIYDYTVITLPVDKNSKENIAVEISEGETTFEIADALKAKNLIRSSWLFASYAKFNKATLLPGIYHLRQSMNFDQIIEQISSGNVQEYKITIPEGWRINQIAQYLQDKKITEYDDFMEAAVDKEGYLFPDTYRIAVDTSAKSVVKTMEDNFFRRTEGLGVSKEKLILASIIEREAKNDEERAKIAGVYQNRLDKNMELEADPTVQYAKGNWEAPTVSDYTKIDSPYNTYLHKGLPPGPICNPGLASIQATINPEKHDYFYFFHTDGKTIFSKTSEEHDANKKKYLK